MESVFWKSIKLRLFGPLRRWKNQKRNSQDFLDRLAVDAAKSEIVIDAGANVGLITKFLLSLEHPRIKSIWAFEPDPEAFSQLAQLEDDRVSKFNEAVWDSDGSTSLYRHRLWEDNHSHTSSSLIKSKSNVDTNNSILVAKKDLAQVIKSCGPNSVTIKMDIEGGEYRVLNHLINSRSMKKVKRIYCEFHPNSIRFGYTKHLFLYVRLLLTGNLGKVSKWF